MLLAACFSYSAASGSTYRVPPSPSIEPLVLDEPETTAWFGIRLGPSTFGIFDAFPNEAGRQAHLSGRVAAALMAKASELFAKPPAIEKVDVLAAKLP